MTTSPIEAAKIATVVIQPSTLSQNVFTRLPMILRLFVINMIINNSGGVEKPCTTPENTSAFIGLNPRKFIDIASNVNAAMAP